MHDRDTQHGASMLTFGQITSRVWDLAIIMFTFDFSSLLQVSVTPQFLYTRIHCCEGSGLPAEYDVKDPAVVKALEAEAAALQLPSSAEDAARGGVIAACDVPKLPPNSPLWSMSGSCVNRAYVEESAQRLMGLTAPLEAIIVFIIMPIGATVSDRSGRRPVLLMYATIALIGCLMLVADAHFASSNSVLLVTGLVVLGAGAEPKDTILLSSIVDMIGHDEVNKSRTVYFLSAFINLAQLCAAIMTYIAARQNLTSWEFPWILLATLAALVLLQCTATLRETLPEELRCPLDWRKLNFVASWQESLSVVWRDWILVAAFSMDFLTTFAFSGFQDTNLSYLVMVGYKPDDVMTLNMVSCFVAVISALCMVPLIARLGVFFSLALSFLLLASGFIVAGPLTLARPGFAYLGCILATAAMSLYKPACLTIISQRVEEGNQGKLLGGFSIGSVVSVLFSAPIFNFILFNADAVGQKVALPSYAAATMAGLNFFLALLLAYAAPRIQSAYDMEKESHQSVFTKLESGDDGESVRNSYGATDTPAA